MANCTCRPGEACSTCAQVEYLPVVMVDDQPFGELLVSEIRTTYEAALKVAQSQVFQLGLPSSFGRVDAAVMKRTVTPWEVVQHRGERRDPSRARDHGNEASS